MTRFARILAMVNMTLWILAPFATGDEIPDNPLCVPVQPEKSAAQIMVGRVISEEETFARLVFSEGLSANAPVRQDCHQVEPEIYQAIAWGVFSRVKMGEKFPQFREKYGAGIRGVTFKPAQFNPAVSPKSRFRQFFLCPTEAKDFRLRWKWTRDAVRKIYSQPKSSPFIQTEWERNRRMSLVSHFYYPLSEQASARPPSWANPNSSARVKNVIVAGKSIPDHCVWFFRHEAPPTPK